MDIWFSAIGDFGFPAAISFYLLHRVERKLDTLNASVHELKFQETEAKRAGSSSYYLQPVEEENDWYQ
ncbi:YvrJ family protein [Salisediminibacterium halotolerans]|uniref:YvrJ protein family protein n=1 Tax=Salisediminibacterium halotolerans TaxID=517425 RepID=A0A1H9WT67_9BACI|nr:YvrJ protein family protein [Salisediminibacterium haloalkalitolerans]